jgi:hypothetical protein
VNARGDVDCSLLLTVPFNMIPIFVVARILVALLLICPVRSLLMPTDALALAAGIGTLGHIRVTHMP